MINSRQHLLTQKILKFLAEVNTQGKKNSISSEGKFMHSSIYNIVIRLCGINSSTLDRKAICVACGNINKSQILDCPHKYETFFCESALLDMFSKKVGFFDKFRASKIFINTDSQS